MREASGLQRVFRGSAVEIQQMFRRADHLGADQVLRQRAVADVRRRDERSAAGANSRRRTRRKPRAAAGARSLRCSYNTSNWSPRAASVAMSSVRETRFRKQPARRYRSSPGSTSHAERRRSRARAAASEANPALQPASRKRRPRVRRRKARIRRLRAAHALEPSLAVYCRGLVVVVGRKPPARSSGIGATNITPQPPQR